MKYAFFVGCVAPVLTRNYELSTRRVAEKLGIELIDLQDFACCGFPLRSIDRDISLLLAARNLSIAEENGLDICTMCPGCSTMLLEASVEMNEGVGLRKEVNEKLREIGRAYKGSVKAKHFNRILYEEVGIKKIRGLVKRSLENLVLAPHYGCHYLKPSRVHNRFEDPEFPRTLDELIEATGAKSVDYEDKIKCCGGYDLGVDEKISFMLSSKKLDNISKAGADAMSLICPLCSIMYDRNQRVISRRLNKSYNLPVLFYTQILGLALGLDPEELGLDMNYVRPTNLLEKL